MKYYIVIPAHNEEAYLAHTLDAILRQTLPPKRVVIVNDHSSDGTEAIIDRHVREYPIFLKHNVSSSTAHLPGGKVVNAFNKGLCLLDDDYDFLVKLDADIVLPDNYFERIVFAFKGNPKLGIAGGFAYEKDDKGQWKLNHPMNKDHVRGAFKSYRKACFKDINGLRAGMGWDTVDELLARYKGYDTYTDPNLRVKHLRPTGKAYDPEAKLAQGKAMYSMRYGFWISCIASLKMAWGQRRPEAFRDNMKGYFLAKKEKRPFLVTREEGAFIRQLRWQGIKGKLRA